MLLAQAAVVKTATRQRVVQAFDWLAFEFTTVCAVQWVSSCSGAPREEKNSWQAMAAAASLRVVSPSTRWLGRRAASSIVQGWVKRVRQHGKTIFVDVGDGRSSTHMQCVLDARKVNLDLHLGSAVKVTGNVVTSPGYQQKEELLADDIELIGPCNPEVYPFQARHREAYTYLRQHPHLRARSNRFAAVLRLRHRVTQAVHRFYEENDFIYIHCPVMSGNDCEGAGELFEVKPAGHRPGNMWQEKGDHSFFGHPVYLTVSSQLHLEAMASSLSKVYTLGPTFRAERSASSRHLAEFHMLEGEVAFTKDLEDVLQVLEKCYKFVVRSVLEKALPDLCAAMVDGTKEQEDYLSRVVEKDFIRMPFHEAITILEKADEKFEFKPQADDNLKSEHEKYLVKHCDNIPVFVTDFPAVTKPFYARDNQDDRHTVAAVDMLVAGMGELAGGSLREERLELLESRLQKLNLLDNYQWYVDLRRFGSVPHGGFGVGFDRLVAHLLNMGSLQDIVPFPRSLGTCDL